MFQIWQIVLEEEVRLLAYCENKEQAFGLIEMLKKLEGTGNTYAYMCIEKEDRCLLKESCEVYGAVVPIYKVNNYTDNWELIDFTMSKEEANQVVKALCWRDVDDYTFRYVADSDYIDRIRLKDVDSTEAM